MRRRLISLLCVFALLLPMFPVKISAAQEITGTPVISVEQIWGAPGQTIDVNISIANNPGILGATLNISWAEDLELISAKKGDAFDELNYQKPSSYDPKGTNFIWYGDSITEVLDGDILTLSFKVAEDAVPGDNLSINIVAKQVIDTNKQAIQVTCGNGSILVIDFIPGDVNEDDVVDLLDVITLVQYVSDDCTTKPDGFNISLNENAANVNDDGVMDLLDVILICQYVSDDCMTKPDGYNVTLIPPTPKCNHTMEATAYKDATCTEDGNINYYHCTACGKYYNDANGSLEISLENTVLAKLGHDSVSVDAVPATPTTPGYTSGVWCERCETWLSGHEEIPPIAPNESNIVYRHYVREENANGTVEIVYDNYLSTHGIENPNPVTYVEGVGVKELYEETELDGTKVSANGYSFLGWFEKPEVGAKRVYSISAEETGDKILYGVWRKNVYTITYLPDSASSILPRVEDDYYTVDKETSLSEPPQWPNLVWIGWSDENGKIVKSIPQGTTGNISLTANWMSRRNQTVPNTKYASSQPAIMIDEENGIYAFTYEIGDIQNVPIQQIEDGAVGKGFNLTKGQTHEINKTFTQKIEQGEATTIANTIANATTKSDSWTLSEDWNKSTSFSQEHSSEITQEQSQKSAIAFSETNKYSLSSGIGGSEEHIDETGTSTKTTSKHEFGVSVNAGIKADIKAGVTAATPFKNASVSADIGLDYKYSKETEKETHETHTDKTSSYWNVDEGFENSNTFSQSAEFSSSIGQSIKDTFSYGETLDYGGSNSNTVSSSNTSSESREYGSSVTYSTEAGESITVSETLTADADTGFYRKVLAANFKVFAVVIYDMKTNTFSTMTYSLKINGSEHLFTDYSTVSSFNDYENGVLPFEVPEFVADYVYGLIGKSEGLRFNEETGVIEGYGYKDPATGICYKKYDERTNTYSEPCDTDVIIPRYVVIDMAGGQKKIVPVTGIAASAFSGTTVTSVYLSDRITEIPTGAFENCTSLKYVRGGNIDTIGDNAFKDCSSLFEFVLRDRVTSLGNNAFEGVNALTVKVSNSDVFSAALASGVKRLTVDLETMDGTIDGMDIITPETMEYFHMIGGGREFSKVKLESTADTVALSNITITNYVDIPLKVSASNVELGFTTIKGRSIIMRLDADNTYVTLDGNNYLTTSGNNVVLSKNVQFLEKEGSSASGKLRVNGDVLVCGKAYGTQFVHFDSEDHKIIYLTEEEYDNLLNTHYVHFDANEGTVEETSRVVNFGEAVGDLPVPVRDYHDFLGWKTADGNDFTADSRIYEDTVVYAQWELKKASGWVLESELPAGAEVLDTKWTYTKTTNTESTATSLDGFTQIGAYWVQSGSGSQNYASFPSGFNTGHSIYTSFTKSVPYSAYENETNKREVNNSWAGYVYWHWMYNVAYANNTSRTIADRKCTFNNLAFHYFFAMTSTVNCPKLDNSYVANYAAGKAPASYNCHSIMPGGSSTTDGRGTPRMLRFDYYKSTYTDYYRVFQYQKIERNLESATEVFASDTISEVQKWVQYRAK